MNMDKLAGIPGTISDEARRIRWLRTADTPAGRWYEAEVPDGTLRALVSQDEVAPGKRLWHVSVSHRNGDGSPGRLPSWDELKHAAYRLVQADVCFVLIFPRRGAPYVDVVENCLHLWQSDKEVDL